jgi:hypothetical protein
LSQREAERHFGHTGNGAAGKREANRYWCIPVVGDGRVFVTDHNGMGITYHDLDGGDLCKLRGMIPAATWIAPAYVAGRLSARSPRRKRPGKQSDRKHEDADSSGDDGRRGR